jgi:hypothetical protein
LECAIWFIWLFRFLGLVKIGAIGLIGMPKESCQKGKTKQWPASVVGGASSFGGCDIMKVEFFNGF